jgi:hypothetical protein
MGPRAQYPEDVKELVRRKYPLCQKREDRLKLARECTELMRQLFPDREVPEMTLQKLYNLASRLKSTRGHATTHADWTAEDEQRYDAKEDVSRLKLRDDPDTLAWSAEDDRYLRDAWGETFIEQIAYMLNRTETAVAYRARELGLRNVPKYYDAKKVMMWLGLRPKELIALTKRGLELFPCCDRKGKVRITLVSTTSLARVLLRDNFWHKLVDLRNADRFFIKDIIESMVAIQNGDASWEPNCWVSHGHTCLNPYAEASFGWFFDGYDRDPQACGLDLDPRDLSPAANVASDNWRRGAWKRAERAPQAIAA